MAHLVSTVRQKIDRLVSSGGHLVLISGPRRSGVTTLVRSYWLQMKGSEDSREFDLAASGSVIDLKRRVQELTDEEEQPLERLLLRLLEDGDSPVAFLNAHRADKDCLTALFAALTKSGIPYATDRIASVFLEGAIDFDQLAVDCGGISAYQPHIHYTSPSPPWRKLADVEEYVSFQGVQEAALAAWLESPRLSRRLS